MLRTVILASYPEAASQLRAALEESNRFYIEQSAPKLPDSKELELSLRVHVPDVVFVEVESLEKTTEIIHIIEALAPGLPVVEAHFPRLHAGDPRAAPGAAPAGFH